MALNETARRIRVAMTYGGFRGRRELAEAIESSAATLQRIEGVAEPARPPKRSELLAIADATGVPMWFLEGGWDGWRATGPSEGGDGSAGPEPDPHSPASMRDLGDPGDRRRAGDEE